MLGQPVHGGALEDDVYRAEIVGERHVVPTSLVATAAVATDHAVPCVAPNTTCSAGSEGESTTGTGGLSTFS